MHETLKKSHLAKLEYHDSNIYLEVYADTIAYERIGNESIIAAIRFGGYPEQVRAMSDVIYSGAVIYAEIDGETYKFRSIVKKYARSYSKDSLYAEATLIALDSNEVTKISIKEKKSSIKQSENDQEDKKSKNSKKEAEEILLPMAAYIFCEQGNADMLYQQLDEKVSIPLIPEFRDYFISELQQRKILHKLHVVSWREKFEAWRIDLTPDEKKIQAVINDGLKQGIISIPGLSENTASFNGVNTVSQYLNTFGKSIAEKIKSQFKPLYDPTNELLSYETVTANAAVRRKAGYNLYDAQLTAVEAIKRSLDKHSTAIVVGECGVGKSVKRS